MGSPAPSEDIQNPSAGCLVAPIPTAHPRRARIPPRENRDSNLWNCPENQPSRDAPPGARVKIFQKEVVRAEGIGLDVLVLTNGAVANASASEVRAAAQLGPSKLKESSTDFFVA